MEGSRRKCYNQVAMEGIQLSTGTDPGETKGDWSGGSGGSVPTATEVLSTLWEEYAPFPQEPRYDPIAEVVFTILSQHTSDRNSERA